MKIGIFGGGFKPLTTGHFSLIALALRENDKVILCYGLSKRKKGSDFVFTVDMATKIYEINKIALKHEFGDRIEVIKGIPTPLTKIFKIIEAVRDVADNEITSSENTLLLSSLNIDAKSVTKLTVYALPEDLSIYTRHLKDEDKELNDISNYIDALKSHYPDDSEESVYDKAKMRGTKFRSLISNKNEEELSKYLPPFLSKDEKQSIIDILIDKENIALQERLLKSFINGFIRG